MTDFPKGSINNPWNIEDIEDDDLQKVKRGDFYRYDTDTDYWYLAVRDGFIRDDASGSSSEPGNKTFHFLGRCTTKDQVTARAALILGQETKETKPSRTIQSALGLSESASKEEIFNKIEDLMAVSAAINGVLEETS